MFGSKKFHVQLPAGAVDDDSIWTRYEQPTGTLGKMQFLRLDITVICGVEIKYTPNYVSMIGSVFCAATDMTIGSTGMFFSK